MLKTGKILRWKASRDIEKSLRRYAGRAPEQYLRLDPYWTHACDAIDVAEDLRRLEALDARLTAVTHSRKRVRNK